MKNNSNVGGWTKWSFTPSKEDIKVFNESLNNSFGVKYILIACSTQLVNGTNYAFLCEAEVATLHNNDYVVVANVYQPIKGQPQVKTIKVVGPKPSSLLGGWSSWQFPVSRKANAVFKEAIGNAIGVNYKPLGDTTQLVAGMNYCFLCEATASVHAPTNYPVLLYICQPLNGKPFIEEIDRISQTNIHVMELEAELVN